MSLVEISKVKTGRRIRKEYGDMESLVDSIRDVGLMHPIVIDEKNNLVAGKRRLLAFKTLRMSKIPATKINIESCKIGEIHENTQRKGFTLKEIAAIAEYVEKTRIGHRPKKGSKLDPFLKGKTVHVVAKITGKSPNQIRKIKNIAAAAKENPDFDRFLEDADKGIKSVETVHKLVTIKERNLPKVKAPKGQYDLMSIDWPYKFKNQTIRGGALLHYPTMTIEEICKFKLPLSDNAIVFHWIPNSMKYDLIEYNGQVKSTMNHILDSHNLTVGTEFIWQKNKPAPGNYNLQYHETLLLCYKGKKVPPAKRFPSVIAAEVGPHSAKPQIFYEMQLEMFPGRKAIEMFTREPHKGFRSWGNEAKK